MQGQQVFCFSFTPFPFCCLSRTANIYFLYKFLLQIAFLFIDNWLDLDQGLTIYIKEFNVYV